MAEDIAASAAQPAASEPFIPSRHGFRFVNRFPGLLPPPKRRKRRPQADTALGLCGGMCFAVLDYRRRGQPVPALADIPERGTPLYRYLWQRQFDSFGILGLYILKFAWWMLLPDGGLRGIQQQTARALAAIRPRLEAGEPVVLGLLTTTLRESPAIWLNHQVLAYGCTETAPGVVDILVYDPNHPSDDTVVIHTETVQVGERKQGKLAGPVSGVTCVQQARGRPIRELHGFFAIPYRPRRLLLPPVES